MNITIFKGFVTLIIGTITGVFISTIGVGAGLITIPSLVVLGMSLHRAVIITLILQLLPQTVPAVYNFWKQGEITNDLITLSLILLVGNLIGTYYGSLFHTKDILTEKQFYKILFVFLLFSAASIYFKHLS